MKGTERQSPRKCVATASLGFGVAGADLLPGRQAQAYRENRGTTQIAGNTCVYGAGARRDGTQRDLLCAAGATSDDQQHVHRCADPFGAERQCCRIGGDRDAVQWLPRRRAQRRGELGAG